MVFEFVNLYMKIYIEERIGKKKEREEKRKERKEIEERNQAGAD